MTSQCLCGRWKAVSDVRRPGQIRARGDEQCRATEGDESPAAGQPDLVPASGGQSCRLCQRPLCSLCGSHQDDGLWVRPYPAASVHIAGSLAAVIYRIRSPFMHSGEFGEEVFSQLLVFMVCVWVHDWAALQWGRPLHNLHLSQSRGMLQVNDSGSSCLSACRC